MHAPLKKKMLKGNQAPFLTKELRKEIYTRSKLENKTEAILSKKIRQYIKNKETNMYHLYDEKRLKCISIM